MGHIEWIVHPKFQIICFYQEQAPKSVFYIRFLHSFWKDISPLFHRFSKLQKNIWIEVNIAYDYFPIPLDQVAASATDRSQITDINK